MAVPLTNNVSAALRAYPDARNRQDDQMCHHYHGKRDERDDDDCGSDDSR